MISLNAVYDDGYDLTDASKVPAMYGDMGIFDAYNPPLWLDTGADSRWPGFKDLVEHVHCNGQRLVSWWNPSYVVLSSPVYQDDGGPDDPDTMFRWMRDQEQDEDQNLCDSTNDECSTSAPYFDGGSKCFWVWDENKNACFGSVWSNQPSVRFGFAERSRACW